MYNCGGHHLVGQKDEKTGQMNLLHGETKVQVFILSDSSWWEDTFWETYKKLLSNGWETQFVAPNGSPIEWGISRECEYPNRSEPLSSLRSPLDRLLNMAIEIVELPIKH